MSDITVEVEPPDNDSPDVVIVENGDSDDVVIEATTVDLVERVTRIEDTLVLVTESLERVTAELASLHATDEMQQVEIEAVAEETEEVAEEAADAVEETVEDIDKASPEITPDELPTVREHFFFRKWGKK